MILECVLAALLSIVVYNFIVKKQGSTLSYVICYCLWLPFWFTLPFYAIPALEIRHLIFKFCLGVITPVTAIFRTTAGKQMLEV
jgi:hypothetical protein